MNRIAGAILMVASGIFCLAASTTNNTNGGLALFPSILLFLFGFGLLLTPDSKK
jgi:hypothetical protein